MTSYVENPTKGNYGVDIESPWKSRSLRKTQGDSVAITRVGRYVPGSHCPIEGASQEAMFVGRGLAEPVRLLSPSVATTG
ncbi:hypothetical protein MULP_03564 [Mycobacterium liflandii 128FXT]|uniref:Uncharacterized protein n=1 Tax=Mycobacterium liflandii (strain 128FXT) TaxID=459424 RepID=L7V5Z4_MYCL1|nr:hypothetical protein MULP_03564 [Mycobacterium liflandii 128FXT]